jgi:phosphomannomutase
MNTDQPLDNMDPHAWLEVDPDLDTRNELLALMDDRAALAERFSTRLSFGTAGLRGKLGAGPSRMNRVLVRLTAHALGRQIQQEGAAERGVVIGYDARPKSSLFAEDTARVLAWLGIPTVLIDGVIPTPVLARACLADGHAAAVMVTASHNPRGDNGYKVYWSDGAQIRSPIDVEIEARIAQSPLLSDGDLRQQPVHRFPARVAIERYVHAVIAPAEHAATTGQFVYTPLSGVAGPTMVAALQHAGFSSYTPVPSQDEPDGSFPGLPFPNPEEPGVLTAAQAVADSAGLDLVLANDPDGDRLGVALCSNDVWRSLTGDEIGALLCDSLLRHHPTPTGVVASSVVSSDLVRRIAESHGIEHRSTLTGFKWIIRPAIDEAELDWVFGYEEALGFSVSGAVRDKDGVSAAMVMLDLVGELRARGASLADRLDELAQQHGLFATTQVMVRLDQKNDQDLMSRLRTNPPAFISNKPVLDWSDWTLREGPDATDLITMSLGDSCTLAIRPSGTEPKIKAYLECHTSSPFADIGAARAAAQDHLSAVANDIQSLLTAPTEVQPSCDSNPSDPQNELVGWTD